MSGHGVRAFARRANVAAGIVTVYAYLQIAGGISGGVLLILRRGPHGCSSFDDGHLCSTGSHPWLAAGIAAIVGAIVVGCLLLMVTYYVRMRAHAAALDYAPDLAEVEHRGEADPAERRYDHDQVTTVIPAPAAWPAPALLDQSSPAGYSPGYSEPDYSRPDYPAPGYPGHPQPAGGYPGSGHPGPRHSDPRLSASPGPFG